MADVFDVANYLLSLADPLEGDLISHLKLQKLLYYSQGVSLALRNQPLFNNKILAWAHGPVVREVWEYYKDCQFQRGLMILYLKKMKKRLLMKLLKSLDNTLRGN